MALLLGLMAPLWPATAQVATATLAGRVTDTVGNPASGVTVEVTYTRDGGGFTELAQVNPDTNGYYVVNNVPVGTYSVYFHTSNPALVSEFWGGSYSASDPVVIGESDRTDINARLDPAAHIAGRVTNEAGAPLAGVMVKAYHPTSDGGWYPSYSQWTDSNGRYNLPSMHPDAYLLSVESKYPYAGEWWQDKRLPSESTPITLALGETRSGIDVELDGLSSLKGRVVTPSGAPTDLTGGLQVCAWQQLENAYTHSEYWDSRCALVQSDGSYTISELAAVPAFLRVDDRRGGGAAAFLPDFYPGVARREDATAFHLSPSTETTAPDFTLHLGGRIEGRITFEDGTSAEDVGMDLFQRVGGAFEPAAAGTAMRHVDADGTYVISPLPSGTYRVRHWGNDTSGAVSKWWNNASSLDSATDIVVTEGVSSGGIDVSFPSTATTPSPTPTATPSPTSPPTPDPTPTSIPVPAPTSSPSPAGNLAFPSSVAVKGKPKVGSRVKVVNYKIGPQTTYSFKWFLGRKAVPKATSKTLRLVGSMRGKLLSVVVTAAAQGETVRRRIKVGKVG